MTTNKCILLILAITYFNLAGAADDRISRSQYIDTWKDEAIKSNGYIWYTSKYNFSARNP